MRTGNDGAALRGLATLWGPGATAGLTDGQLLERYATGSGEAAELAFEALVERHGAMVSRVCRAHLADPRDAQDAFQATFLVLVRKARGLWVRDSLGPWLHQVARRSALRVRSTAARRRTVEQKAAEETPEAVAESPRPEFDLEEALHEEISRLPDRLRAPIVLCDLQGLSCEEAARRMNRPVGTVKSWRSRGRDRLRSRLTRRGLAPSAALFAPVVGLATGSIPTRTMAGKVSASALETARGVLRTMFLNKLKTAAAATLAAALFAGGAAAIAWTGANDPPQPKPAAAAPEANDETATTRPLTLQEAIRIGLANADFVRVVSDPGEKGPFKIAPKGEMDEAEFKWKVRERVDLTEITYWWLRAGRGSVELTKTAVKMTEEVHKREEAKVAAGESDEKVAADVWRRLEELKSKVADMEAGGDQRFRKFLGLAADDGRKIVPVTPLAKTFREWDREAWSANEAKRMNESELRRVDFVDLQLRKTRKSVEEASKERRAAAEELAAEARRYESGRVLPDDYLNAISRFTQASKSELNGWAQYNVWLAEFDDALGILLDRDQIEIVESP